jgi:hypothetical protein
MPASSLGPELAIIIVDSDPVMAGPKSSAAAGSASGWRRDDGSSHPRLIWRSGVEASGKRRCVADGELLIRGPVPLPAGVLRSSIERRLVEAVSAVLDGR